MKKSRDFIEGRTEYDTARQSKIRSQEKRKRKL